MKWEVYIDEETEVYGVTYSDPMQCDEPAKEVWLPTITPFDARSLAYWLNKFQVIPCIQTK